MTDLEILIKSSGNTGALLPFEENRVLFDGNNLIRRPLFVSLFRGKFLTQIYVRARCERGRALLFVSLATFVSNFRGGQGLTVYRHGHL